jgi:cholesterol oxidase
VFGYENLIVCDAAALPANPGVNPALTITALAEYGIAQVPPKADADRVAADVGQQADGAGRRAMGA